jgi:hypothetical protein
MVLGSPRSRLSMTALQTSERARDLRPDYGLGLYLSASGIACEAAESVERGVYTAVCDPKCSSFGGVLCRRSAGRLLIEQGN